jgi:hypothetical protein
VPLPLAPLVAALLGVAFGLLGRDEVRRTTASPTATRGFLVLTLVALLLLAPALGYFLAFYPDWAWSYLVPGARVPSAVDLVAVLIASGVAPLAYVWTASALRRHAVRELVRGVSALVVFFAIGFALLGPRMIVAGSYAAYHEGYDLASPSSTSLGVSIVWIDGCLLAGVAWAATRIRALSQA